MRWLVCLLGTCLAVGCTDRASDDDGNDSGADGDSSAGDGSGTSGGSATSGGSDSADSGDTGPSSCVPEDPDIGPPVTVSITNTLPNPIYIPQVTACAVTGPFVVTRDDVVVPWQFEDCTSCAAAVSGACGCPAACPIDAVIRLDPGGSWEGTWPGTEAMQVTLEPECVQDDFCGPACMTSVAAPAGEYVIEVETAVDVDCFGEPDCPCQGDPDAAGWCVVSGTLAGDQATRIGQLTYPDANLVEVTI